MFIYLLSFFSSTLFIYVGGKMDTNNNDAIINLCKKIIYLLLILIALLIPSLLAGLRDYSIGTDVLTYGNYWFNKALFNDFNTYVNWATSSSIGYLYATFNYIVSKFTTNPHWFYFIYNFMENMIVYIAIRKNKDILNVPIAMIIYYFLFYNLLLNILRQGMALALILLSVNYIRKEQNIKYFLCLFIAYLFHSSAIIGISLWIIFYVLKLNVGTMTTRRNFLIGTEVLFSFLIIPVVPFLNNIGIINNRYAAYINDNNIGGGFYQHLLLLCLPILMLYFFSFRKEENYMYNFFFLVVLMSAILSFLTIRFAYLNRLIEYFDIIFVLAIPYIIKNGTLKIMLNNYNILSSLVIVYVIIYWIIIYVVFNSGETIPYMFMQY